MTNRPTFPSALTLGVLAIALLVAGCGYVRRPEERTDDGLVRVHSRDVAGVYRAPGAEFRQYRKVILEPAVVAFRPRWREAHADVTDNQLMLIVQDAVALFYEEFKRELIEKGGYEFAEEPGPDVLLISPRVTDLNIHAPDWSPKTYVPSTLTMQVSGDLHDGVSNALVGRVIIFENSEDSGGFGLTLADRVTNAHEMRMGFRKWSKMIIEALNVAKATRPPI
jgi:hypothetical protein